MSDELPAEIDNLFFRCTVRYGVAFMDYRRHFGGRHSDEPEHDAAAEIVPVILKECRGCGDLVDRRTLIDARCSRCMDVKQLERGTTL